MVHAFLLSATTVQYMDIKYIYSSFHNGMISLIWHVYKVFTQTHTDLLVSESCPDSVELNPGVALPPSPGPAIRHRGSDPEPGLDFGLSANTEEEAESLRKVCLTGDALLGELEYESLSLSCMSGIFCGEEGGMRKPMPSVAEE